MTIITLESLLQELEEYDLTLHREEVSPSHIQFQFKCRKTRRLHRIRGPAVMSGKYKYEAWYKKGMYHRDGELPTIIEPNHIEYHTNGIHMKDNGPAYLEYSHCRGRVGYYIKSLKDNSIKALTDDSCWYKLIDMRTNGVICQSFYEDKIREKEMKYLAKGMPVIIKKYPIPRLKIIQIRKELEETYKREYRDEFNKIMALNLPTNHERIIILPY